MVTDNQVRKLMKLSKREKTLGQASAKAGMDEKTARKYLRVQKLPSGLKTEHTWKTREDPFVSDWEAVKNKLELNPGLEGKTLFEDLQRRFPGKYQDGQLRTFQRKVKQWRVLSGPEKEIYFSQNHEPGRMCQSDFTHMGSLGITIEGSRFEHLIYHFVLTYSNWESGTICFSESYESLSEGFQNAIWELGGTPLKHQTDSLSAAVRKPNSQEEFTERYSALLRHYKIEGQKTNPSSPNENGTIEQRNHRFKRAVEQSLLLRGSRNFMSREEYEVFLKDIFAQLNSGRRKKLLEEIAKLRSMPKERLESVKQTKVKVSKGSTIRVNHNVYSVASRLIGQEVKIKLYVEHLELWYGQKCIEKIPRLKGVDKSRIEYRHIITWLVRKPGAFTNYIYREEMFPTHRFRMAFDILQRRKPGKANKEYLGILYLAARENEQRVDRILLYLIENEEEISKKKVEELLGEEANENNIQQIKIEAVNLSRYDNLLENTGGIYA